MIKKIVKIKDIILDKSLYPREKPNESIIREYARDMERGNVFPPIFLGLYKEKLYLIDGKHRIDAKEINDEQYIQAEIKDNFPDFESMFLASIRANLRHGVRMTEGDRLKVAIMLKDMDYDVGDITKLVGISASKLDKDAQYKESQLIFKTKVQKGTYPSKLTEKISKGIGDLGVIDDQESKRFAEKNKNLIQVVELKRIYSFIKREKFDTKNKKIKSLLKKIRNSITLR